VGKLEKTPLLTAIWERLASYFYPLEVVVVLTLMAWYGTMVYISVKDLNSYKELFTNAVVLPTVLQTIKICLPVAVLVMVISYIMAFFAYAYIPHLVGPFLALLLLPYVSSYYVILLGWRAWVGEDGLFNRLPILSSLADILSYGIPSLIIVMILRYLPLSVLLVYVRLRALPVTQIHVARNLGLTCAGIHHRLYLRWCLPVLVMVGVFSFIFASLDYLASSVVGGGSVQTLANLIDDWQRAQAFQGPAMALGVFYASVLTVFAFLTMCLLSLRVGQVSETSQSEDRLSFGGVEGWLVSGITLIVMVVQLMMIIGILYLALGGLEGAFPTIKPFLSFLTDDELKHAFLLSLLIGAVAAIVSAVLSVFSLFARHIRDNLSLAVEAGGRMNTGHYMLAAANAGLLMLLVIPPLLAGIAANAFQGRVLHYFGSTHSIIAVHIIAYSPIAFFVAAGGLARLSPTGYLVARNLGVGLSTYFVKIFLRVCFLPIIAGCFVLFAFSLNDHILARYVGGITQNLGILVADKQVAGLESKHVCAVAAMFALTLGTFVPIITCVRLAERPKKPHMSLTVRRSGKHESARHD
jgi:putative spermidine/putrescine transport system permease protein/spermidine/putrescine transport system permease protein